jgi:hypothetical protein
MAHGTAFGDSNHGIPSAQEMEALRRFGLPLHLPIPDELRALLPGLPEALRGHASTLVIPPPPPPGLLPAAMASTEPLQLPGLTAISPSSRTEFDRSARSYDPERRESHPEIKKESPQDALAMPFSEYRTADAGRKFQSHIYRHLLYLLYLFDMLVPKCSEKEYCVVKQ